MSVLNRTVGAVSAQTIAMANRTQLVLDAMNDKSINIAQIMMQIAAHLDAERGHIKSRPQKPADSKEMASYRKALEAWTRQLAELSEKRVQLYQKLQTAQMDLNRLRQSDLPQAQQLDRQEAEKLFQVLKKLQEQMDTQVRGYLDRAGEKEQDEVARDGSKQIPPLRLTLKEAIISAQAEEELKKDELAGLSIAEIVRRASYVIDSSGANKPLSTSPLRSDKITGRNLSTAGSGIPND